MRLFFAIELPEEIKYKLRETLLELKRTGVPASLSKYHQLHITLVFLGEKTEEEAATIIEEVNRLRMGKFDLEIGKIGFFPSENFIRTLWVGAADANGELKLLHSKICKSIGMAPDKEFKSHVTLARVKSRESINKLKEFQKNHEENSFGDFEVDQYVLMQSNLTADGYKYSVVGKFPLV